MKKLKKINSVVGKVWEIKDLPNTSKKILLYFAYLMDTSQDLDPPIWEIADKCSCSISSVHRHLHVLIEKGYLKRKHRWILSFHFPDENIFLTIQTARQLREHTHEKIANHFVPNCRKWDIPHDNQISNIYALFIT